MTQLSIIVATRNRAASLEKMLGTLDLAVERVPATIEVIVVDNGSRDETPALLKSWCGRGARRMRLTVPEGGKARALNAAILRTQGVLLAFTDDDVEVPLDWPIRIIEFFAHNPIYAGATGRTRLSPAVAAPPILAKVTLYQTLPLFDRGDRVLDTTHLYGCNMALRRSTLQAIGDFDERLGPGASGLHEDGDLAQRVRAAGLRIAYVPQMLMYHTVDPSRLTWESFASRHRADALSRFIQRGNRGIRYGVQHWLGAVLVWLCWSALRQPQRRMRARGRMLSHQEQIRLALSAFLSTPTAAATRGDLEPNEGTLSARVRIACEIDEVEKPRRLIRASAFYRSTAKVDAGGRWGILRGRTR